MADARGKLPMDENFLEMPAVVEFEHLASVYETYTGKIGTGKPPGQLSHVLRRVSPEPSWKEAVKRTIDVGGLIGAVLVAPVSACLASFIR